MSGIIKTIRHCRHMCNKAITLRLCEKQHYGICTGYISKRTLNSFLRYPEKYVYPFPHRNYANVSLKEKPVAQDADDQTLQVHESESMHKFLENSHHYTTTIMPSLIGKLSIDDVEVERLLSQDWSSATTSEVYNTIKKIAYNRMENSVLFAPEKYGNILEALINKLPELENEKMQNLFRYIKPLYRECKNCKIYPLLVKRLNEECLKRFFKGSTNDLLLICDGFYQIHEPNCDFVWRAIRKISNKVYKLPSKTLVQFAFILGECRRPPVNMYDIEYRVGECLEELGISEIGIIARGFFKTSTKIKSSHLLNSIIRKVTTGIGTIDNITLAAIMKLLRYSSMLQETSVFRILFCAIVPEVPRLTLMSLTHVAHAASSVGIYERDLMQKIIERLKAEVAFARLKDIERIAHTISMICPESDDNDIFDVIVAELVGTFKSSREYEIEKFPNSLPRILEKLSYRNIYPKELFEVVFCPKMITKLIQRGLFTRDFWTLHCNILIDQPDYTGPLLSTAAIRISIKKFCTPIEHLPQVNKTLKMTKEIVFRCKEVLKTDICVTQVLPNHVSMDIIIGFDENGRNVAVKDILSKMDHGSIKRVDTDELKKIKWKALVVIPLTQIVKGTNEYNGVIKAKLRHLRTIGYTPIVISQFDWDRCFTEEDKFNFVREKIYSS